MSTLSSWWQQYLRSRYKKIKFYDIYQSEIDTNSKSNYYTITIRDTPILFSSKSSAQVNFYWTEGMLDIFFECLRATSVRGYILVADVVPIKEDPNIIGHEWIHDEMFNDYFRYFEINEKDMAWLKDFMSNINFSPDYICFGGIIEEFPLDLFFDDKREDRKITLNDSLRYFISDCDEYKGVEFHKYTIMCRNFPRIQEVLLDKLEQIRLRKLGLIDP